MLNLYPDEIDPLTRTLSQDATPKKSRTDGGHGNQDALEDKCRALESDITTLISYLLCLKSLCIQNRLLIPPLPKLSNYAPQFDNGTELPTGEPLSAAASAAEPHLPVRSGNATTNAPGQLSTSEPMQLTSTSSADSAASSLSSSFEARVEKGSDSNVDIGATTSSILSEEPIQGDPWQNIIRRMYPSRLGLMRPGHKVILEKQIQNWLVSQLGPERGLKAVASYRDKTSPCIPESLLKAFKEWITTNFDLTLRRIQKPAQVVNAAAAVGTISTPSTANPTIPAPLSSTATNSTQALLIPKVGPLQPAAGLLIPKTTLEASAQDTALSGDTSISTDSSSVILTSADVQSIFAAAASMPELVYQYPDPPLVVNMSVNLPKYRAWTDVIRARHKQYCDPSALAYKMVETFLQTFNIPKTPIFAQYQTVDTKFSFAIPESYQKPFVAYMEKFLLAELRTPQLVPQISNTSETEKRDPKPRNVSWITLMRQKCPSFIEEIITTRKKYQKVLNFVSKYMRENSCKYGFALEDCLCEGEKNPRRDGIPLYGIPVIMQSRFQDWFERQVQNGFSKYVVLPADDTPDLQLILGQNIVTSTSHQADADLAQNPSSSENNSESIFSYLLDDEREYLESLPEPFSLESTSAAPNISEASVVSTNTAGEDLGSSICQYTAPDPLVTAQALAVLEVPVSADDADIAEEMIKWLEADTKRSMRRRLMEDCYFAFSYECVDEDHMTPAEVRGAHIVEKLAIAVESLLQANNHVYQSVPQRAYQWGSFRPRKRHKWMHPSDISKANSNEYDEESEDDSDWESQGPQNKSTRLCRFRARQRRQDAVRPTPLAKVTRKVIMKRLPSRGSKSIPSTAVAGRQTKTSMRAAETMKRQTRNSMKSAGVIKVVRNVRSVKKRKAVDKKGAADDALSEGEAALKGRTIAQTRDRGTKLNPNSDDESAAERFVNRSTKSERRKSQTTKSDASNSEDESTSDANVTSRRSSRTRAAAKGAEAKASSPVEESASEREISLPRKARAKRREETVSARNSEIDSASAEGGPTRKKTRTAAKEEKFSAQNFENVSGLDKELFVGRKTRAKAKEEKAYAQNSVSESTSETVRLAWRETRAKLRELNQMSRQSRENSKDETVAKSSFLRKKQVRRDGLPPEKNQIASPRRTRSAKSSAQTSRQPSPRPRSTKGSETVSNIISPLSDIQTRRSSVRPESKPFTQSIFSKEPKTETIAQTKTPPDNIKKVPSRQAVPDVAKKDIAESETSGVDNLAETTDEKKNSDKPSSTQQIDTPAHCAAANPVKKTIAASKPATIIKGLKVTTPNGLTLYRYNVALPTEAKVAVKKAVRSFLLQEMGEKIKDCILWSESSDFQTYGVPDFLVPKFNSWAAQELKRCFPNAEIVHPSKAA
ncbi:hypothetical protein HDV05_000128 [Chytridiales sp. JEL 0842]|nr:hypothetical protein HDV05_000128 [Chytridiales sp. JEL 0842]